MSIPHPNPVLLYMTKTFCSYDYVKDLEMESFSELSSGLNITKYKGPYKREAGDHSE